MILQFWGVRGSLPVPGPQTVTFGGNTPCVSIQVEGEPLLILDAGTGIRALGRDLMERSRHGRINLMLSHGHWDHLQGFPFFLPAYQPETRIAVMGASFAGCDPRALLHHLMGGSHFPVPLRGLNASITFHDLIRGWQNLGRIRVRPIPALHPGGGSGFRIESGGASVVYLTDNELPPDPADWQPFIDAVRGATVLIHDSQYSDGEIARYRGWGHSTMEQSVQLAAMAGVETLYLFHHDPDRSDADLWQMENEARALARKAGSHLEVAAAAEGMRRVVAPALASRVLEASARGSSSLGAPVLSSPALAAAG